MRVVNAVGAPASIRPSNPLPVATSGVGRTFVNASTVIAGVTAVVAEAMLTLQVSRNAAATAPVSSIAVTAGKRYRITGINVGIVSSAAAVISGRVALRVSASGAVSTASPIVAIASMSQQAAALAQAGDTVALTFPEGIEITGTQQVGLSQLCSVATGAVFASLIGYEY